ncbi:deoxyribose-phosphate aldolase [Saccharicrinis sp. FJH2]|uniref:deoxyribose-phosphate aldolase n=1 Tax=Saccharicrinis sp. FJH65 TaxID=3344659 RepID=UPI0035F38E24
MKHEEINKELSSKILDCLTQYRFKADEATIDKELNGIKAKVDENKSKDVYKTIFSLIDLTTLNVQDNKTRINAFVNKVNQFQSNFKDVPNVAAICTWPSLIGQVRDTLNVEGVSCCAVSAGFPEWHTFTEVKIAETSLTIMDGADEIDIVINVGELLDEDYDNVFDDISEIKSACGEKKLKVILETGALKSTETIKTASIIAMEAGADFIKTSTGKISPAATPEAFLVMVKAIKEFGEKSGKKIGIKPAGGISTTEEALLYYTIVKEVLGKEWLNNKFFRIGASRLANDVLGQITGKEVSYFG